MKRSLIWRILNLEYLLAALLTAAFVAVVGAVTQFLPSTGETSFLNPFFSRFDFLDIEDVSLDVIFAFKDARFPESKIVVVDIGEVAPAPDGKIAKLLHRANEWRAKAIGLDIIFDSLHFERFPAERADEIDSLLAAFAATPNLVVVNGYRDDPPVPELVLDERISALVAHTGFANLETDGDGFVRKYYPYRTVNGDRWLAFTTQLMRLYDSSLAAPVFNRPEEAQIIYYSATYTQFVSHSIDDVISADSALIRRYRELFDGAIVIAGYVNKGDVWYFGDTHKTPMGRKTRITQPDGSVVVGIDGPDMPGLLIHANILTMLMRGEFIAPVSAATDWLLVVLLAYVSIAFYRSFRAKPSGDTRYNLMITAMLFAETVMVFFLPIISYFYFGVKISYNLMATAVVLFIPSHALVEKMRFQWMRWETRIRKNGLPDFLNRRLADVFSDLSPLPAYTRLTHAAFSLLHFAYAWERSGKSAAPNNPPVPGMETYAECIPAIRNVLVAAEEGDRKAMYFYQYLDGIKELHLRSSYVRNLLYSTKTSLFNRYVYYEEWELLVPYVMKMYYKDFASYRDIALFAIAQEEGATKKCIDFGTSPPEIVIQHPERFQPGVYGVQASNPSEIRRLSPYIVHAECKLHRKTEIFILSGLLRKQEQADLLPAYYGEAISCEPVLPGWVIPELFTFR